MRPVCISESKGPVLGDSTFGVFCLESSGEANYLLSIKPAVISFCHIGDYESFFILGILPCEFFTRIAM